MAAPIFISKGTYDFSDTGTINPTYPAGIQSGDILFILAFSQQEGVTIGSITTPSDFTNLSGGGISNSNPDPIGGFQVFYKIATGSEAGTVSVSRTGSTGGSTLFIAQIYQFRGTIIAIEPDYTPTVGSSSTITWGTIALTGNERTLLAFCAQNDDSGVGAPSGGYIQEANDDVPSIPSGQLTLSVLENVSSDGAVTNGDGSAAGWGTLHVAIFNVKGRSFIVN